MSKSGAVTRKAKITTLGLAGSFSGVDYINVGCQTVETPQQFGFNIVLSRDEVKRLGVTIGDFLAITVNP